LNHFAKLNRITLDSKQGKARTGRGTVAGNEVILAKPQTYMNLSGQSVSILMQKYHIDISDLIVIHDDLDIPLGKIRIRQGSSAGGHNGIKSIISSLNTQDFIRIRVGIGRPLSPGESKEDTIKDYVLSDFTREDRQITEDIIRRVSEAVICLITEGLSTAMNKFN
jgi:peptidyl-tRNA hydrolase, PTH1 family